MSLYYYDLSWKLMLKVIYLYRQNNRQPGSHITIFIIYNPLALFSVFLTSIVSSSVQPSLLVWTGEDWSGVMLTPGLAYQTA